jgi:hypothetical protein
MNVKMNVNKFENKITIDSSKGVGDHREIFNIDITKLIVSLNRKFKVCNSKQNAFKACRKILLAHQSC